MPIRKKSILFCVMLVLMSVLFSGCSSSASDAEEVLLEEQAGSAEEAQEKDPGETNPGQSENQKDSEKPEAPAEAEADPSDMPCTVYVCGAVNTPGVYELPAGSRIYEALDAAGGTCAEADPVFLNRAGELQDGQQIYVPTVEEAKALGQPGAVQAIQAVPGSSGATGGTDGKVNLNTASKEELMTLTGIGEAKAQSILAYREEHGGFAAIEELMQIPGIKEGVFTKIKDGITVA